MGDNACLAQAGGTPVAGRVPIMARRRTISSGKLALDEAMAANAPNIIVTCGGTFSCLVDCKQAHCRVNRWQHTFL